MGDVRAFAERAWNGETGGSPPMMAMLGLEEYAPGVAFVASFANVAAIATEDGLVVIDVGSIFSGASTRAALAGWSPRAVHTAVFTHGHLDHVMGIGAFESDGRVQVVAHAAIVERFDRYRLTAGYNGAINARQFRIPGLEWPRTFRDPDVLFRERHLLDIGGERFELFHDRGETDDHTWVFVPSRRLLCTGDLFIWASPNCGNPQKAQRYPREWAAALRKMRLLEAELLFPGHGPPIEGAERVSRALDETASLLETLTSQTLTLLNEGAPLDVILQSVTAPAELLARPYLGPTYDEPQFIVRNLWRLYAGWWDGNPAHLKPPGEDALAGEVVRLSGGAERVATRALALSTEGEHALACQLADWALRADPGDAEILRVRQSVFRRRVEFETSLMAKSIFTAAAEEIASGKQAETVEGEAKKV